jgi:Uma2 family endonuclease
MMATTSHLLTWAAFEQIPDDGMHRELIEGELQVLPPPKSKHSKIAKRVSRILDKVEVLGNGVCYVEAGYKLSDDAATWLEPDVSFLTRDRDRSAPDDGYFHGAPELALR